MIVSVVGFVLGDPKLKILDHYGFVNTIFYGVTDIKRIVHTHRDDTESMDSCRIVTVDRSVSADFLPNDIARFRVYLWQKGEMVRSMPASFPPPVLAAKPYRRGVLFRLLYHI